MKIWEIREEVGFFILRESKDGKEYKVKSERGCYVEGVEVGVFVLKGVSDLE